MTNDDGVSHGELQRRLEALAHTAVRKDVYDADEKRRQVERSADRAELHDLEGDVDDMKQRLDKAEERRSSDRRLWLSSLAFPLIVGVILLVLTALGSR